VIFSNIFLPILHNIGWYIYTVKYKSGIKIPGFSSKYFKKKTKKIQNIFKKKKYFVAYGQILKFFSSIFFIKKKKQNKTKIASFSCFEISKKN
jgi:histidinol phosphatase-like enzyme